MGRWQCGFFGTPRGLGLAAAATPAAFFPQRELLKRRFNVRTRALDEAAPRQLGRYRTMARTLASRARSSSLIAHVCPQIRQ